MSKGEKILLSETCCTFPVSEIRDEEVAPSQTVRTLESFSLDPGHPTKFLPHYGDTDVDSFDTSSDIYC